MENVFSSHSLPSEFNQKSVVLVKIKKTRKTKFQKKKNPNRAQGLVNTFVFYFLSLSSAAADPIYGIKDYHTQSRTFACVFFGFYYRLFLFVFHSSPILPHTCAYTIPFPRTLCDAPSTFLVFFPSTSLPRNSVSELTCPIISRGDDAG